MMISISIKGQFWSKQWLKLGYFRLNVDESWSECLYSQYEGQVWIQFDIGGPHDICDSNVIKIL